MRSEDELRAKIEEFTARMDGPEVNTSGRTVLHIRIETLNWALGEEDDDA